MDEFQDVKIIGLDENRYPYVRDMNHNHEHLEMLKKIITNCNEQHKEKCLQQALDEKQNKQSEQNGGGAQGKLDAIIEKLNFSV